MDARISRTGIQVYRDSDGRMVREYRPPEEVFSAESLASLSGAAVTIKHPPGDVNPNNWRSVSHGVARDAAGREDTDDGSFVVGNLMLQTNEVLTGVDTGDLVEVSAGYEARIDETPGVSPDGQEYDRGQRDIRFNHVALGGPGFARAGRNAVLRLDGNESTDPEVEKSMAFRIDGQSVEGEAPVQSAIDALMGDRDAHKSRADSAEGKASALENDLGKAQAERDELQKRIDGMPDLVAAEVEFRSQVKSVLPKHDCSKGTRRDTMLAVIKAAEMQEPPPSASDDYVSGVFSVAVAKGGGFNRRDNKDSQPRQDGASGYVSRMDQVINKTWEGK